jgi:hypothetical protein
MTQKFNKVCYIELVKKDQTLRSKNSSLAKENTLEDRELRSYRIMLESQVFL